MCRTAVSQVPSLLGRGYSRHAANHSPASSGLGSASRLFPTANAVSFLLPPGLPALCWSSEPPQPHKLLQHSLTLFSTPSPTPTSHARGSWLLSPRAEYFHTAWPLPVLLLFTWNGHFLKPSFLPIERPS